MANLGSVGFFAGKLQTQDGFTATPPIGQPLQSTTLIPKALNIVANNPSTVLFESDGLDYLCEGIVSVLGTPTAGYLVRAFRRDTGGLLGQATSGVGGVFSIGFNGFDGEVTCIAYDNTGASPDYNAVVFDRVVPVLA
jgi:hypothetical protein